MPEVLLKAFPARRRHQVLGERHVAFGRNKAAHRQGVLEPPQRDIDAMREATRGLTLREIIVHMLEASGLVDFYRTDREGAERLENLEELINAAEAFVTQEGFGKDAVALPVDEVAERSGIAPFGGTLPGPADGGPVFPFLSLWFSHVRRPAP